MSRGVFSLVDVNKNGDIEDVEVEVAILQLYNQGARREGGAWDGLRVYTCARGVDDPPLRLQ